MQAWAGIERFLQLSLGSQVGASGVALIAVIELKRMVQQQLGSQEKSGTKTVRLTAEEWRTVAGIHERKTFERARNKLVELGVLHIERDGKLLVVGLWPDIDEGTSLATSPGIDCGTGSGTSFGTSSETDSVSLSQRALKSREDVVFPRQDVPENVISVRDNELPRYPLNHHSLNRQYNNENNDITDNDQRGNEEQLEFAICWMEEVGHPLTPYEKEGLDRFVRLGYTGDLLMEALRCAVAADNRQMGYVLGILRNWYQEGVRCIEDIDVAKKRWDDLRFLKRSEVS
ncbi:DnaD domain protein [Desulfosporosinus sp. Sb-LF]|uniref:DnaD domain-containing protein n=1 Tax=Desulfosporosinus sp. Sb-LF TaxID=2560027 RepID=UPI00107F6198|nr:DnaD domain protein [Desulfosporosinus sp. Sb-LF]TGE31884.1 DnaD domain protein [Desulfosporosinus sp. Sb-LF]